MTVLSVNLNKVAALRNARGGDRPDVLWAGRTVIAAGAAGLTVHPRPDLRHIRPDDVYALADLAAAATGIEYNIEGNPFSGPADGYPGFMELVRAVRPTQATLVPDSVDQITSNHGWDLERDGARLAPLVAELTDLGCRVSLFMDPVAGAMASAARVGAHRVELYTESYAKAHATGDFATELASYAAAAAAARAEGLGVNAGHDLNLQNLRDFCTIPEILEVSIGHALISDALNYGLTDTVHRYLECLR